jgi:hypothetical protein
MNKFGLLFLVRARAFRASAVSFAVAICGASVLVQGAADSSRPGEVKVEATGTSETRDGAVIDACRLAVSKVHGTRVVGRMGNRDAKGIKADVKGNKGLVDFSLNANVRTYEVADNTQMSFDGLLLRFEVKKEEKAKDGRWTVQISADVLNVLPDKFAGKQAVILPSASKIAKSLSSGNAGPALVGEIARELSNALGTTFSNHPQFVLLEREAEDAVDAELARAASGDAAVKEQSKLQAQKIGDIVVEVKSDPLSIQVEPVIFENTPPLQKVQVQLKGTIRLIDVPTKGEICRTTFEAGNLKPVTSVGSADAAIAKALVDLRGTLDASLRLVKCDLLAKLGVANLVLGQSGEWILGGGLDPALLRTGDQLSLWKGTGSSMTKVTEGSIVVESNKLRFDSLPVKMTQGEAYSFRIDSSQTRSTSVSRQSVRDANEPSNQKPSLKDRLKFE